MKQDESGLSSYTSIGNPAPGLGQRLRELGWIRYPIVIGGLLLLLALAIWRYA